MVYRSTGGRYEAKQEKSWGADWQGGHEAAPARPETGRGDQQIGKMQMQINVPKIVQTGMINVKM